jgi:hypothetical protein
MGKTDRLSRIGAGVVLVGFGMITGNPLGWIGAVCIATGVLGWCPLYGPLGIDTCHKETEEHGHH